MKTKQSSLTYLYLFGLLLYILLAIFRPFISDEFHEAHLVNGLFDQIPYWEKVYYKNVLGYYIKFPFLRLGLDWWNSLIASRIFLSITFVSSLFLTLKLNLDWARGESICMGFLVTLFFTQNLAHASSYRVDMLTMIFGLFALNCILNKKLIWAGVLASISFLISQKGGIYCLAGAFAILWSSENRIKDLSKYSVAGIMVALIYIIFWSVGSDFKSVLKIMFVNDTNMITNAGYSIRHYWIRSFATNPYIYIFILLGFLTPRMSKEKSKKRIQILVFSFIVFLICLSLGQPWPYYFVLLTPVILFNIIIFLDFFFKKNEKMAILCCSISIFHCSVAFFLTQNISNDYQKYNLKLMEKILNKNDKYIAGLNLHPSYVQPLPELEALHKIQRDNLATFSSREKEKLVDSIKINPAKVLISNYRTLSLSDYLLKALYNQYVHWHANVFVYGHLLAPSDTTKYNGIKGRYFIDSDTGYSIKINDTLYQVGNYVELDKGSFKVETDHNFILRLELPLKRTSENMSYRKARSLNLTYEL